MAKLAAAVLVMLIASQGIAAADKSTPVNLLVIVTDDQRWDELGVVQKELGKEARFPFVKTPHLDALASEGIRFRNAFVTTSLCSPSRSAILTGQYNHTNNIIDNFTAFVARPTWATALKTAGYTTAYVGKWHHGENQWERPGFDYIATYAGHGRYQDATFKVNNEWLNTKTKGYIDARSVDFAIDFFEQRHSKPFAMMVGFKAPHIPVAPMEEHKNLYVNKALKPPANWDATAPWLDLKLPVIHPHRPYSSNWKRLAPRMQTITSIDTNVGRLLEALERNNLSNNTLVIFMSDNGFYLGEHRLGDKRSAYEESIRIPMIARLPGVIRAGSVSDEMVLNIDIAPTFLDMANQAIPDAMHGMSLRPLLQEKSVTWRQAFLYEYWQENEFWQKHHVGRTPTILALRTATDKLITYPDFPKWTELYSLSSDPFETRNLVGYRSSLDRQIEMCQLLQDMLEETGYVEKPSLDKWLIGLTNSYVSYLAHERKPVAERHPPLRFPNC